MSLALLRRARPMLIDAMCALGIAAAVLAPSASDAAVISQTISFDTIEPFGTFTDGTFTLADWSSAFPVNSIDEVERFWVHFESDDRFYQAQLGPLGGVPWIEFGYRDDSNARHAFASMGLNAHTVSFGEENPAHFALFKSLLADGVLTVAPGGYESFPDHSDDFVFHGLATLTLSFELPDGSGGGDEPDPVDPGPGPGTNAVPEPSAAALALTALLAAAGVRRRRNRD